MQSFASVAIDSSSFVNNTALTGGALFVGDRYAGSISNSLFDSCTSKTSGAAMVIGGYSNPAISNCKVSNCVADSIGSGIITLAFSTPTFENLTIM